MELPVLLPSGGRAGTVHPVVKVADGTSRGPGPAVASPETAGPGPARGHTAASTSAEATREPAARASTATQVRNGRHPSASCR